MFEGAVREGNALPAGWWLLWVAIACGLALLRTVHPDCIRQSQWAWTNWRLLYQAKGDNTGWTLVDGLSNGLAGLSLSLSVSGMWSVAHGGVFTWSLFFRLWMLWFLMMAIRWCIRHLMGLASGSSLLGREWVLSHRVVLESTFWVIAPLGIAATFKGPEAARFGLVLSGVIWLTCWILRQHRVVMRLELFGRNRLMTMLYLCALEVLPVAVFCRAWQG